MTGKIKIILLISAVFVITLVLSFSLRAYANDKKGREYRESVCAKENGTFSVPLNTYSFIAAHSSTGPARPKRASKASSISHNEQI